MNRDGGMSQEREEKRERERGKELLQVKKGSTTEKQPLRSCHTQTGLSAEKATEMTCRSLIQVFLLMLPISRHMSRTHGHFYT